MNNRKTADRAVEMFGIHEDALAYIKSSVPAQLVLIQALDLLDTGAAILNLNSAKPGLPLSELMELSQAALDAAKTVHELELKGREMQRLDAKRVRSELDTALLERDEALSNLDKVLREAERARDLFVGKKTDIYTFSWEE